MPSRSFLFGAVVGAVATYLLDPNVGRQRRAQVQSWADQNIDPELKRKATQKAQAIAGQVVDATRPLHDQGPGSDPALVDKVRSEVLGRDEFSDVSVNIDAVDGVVTLRGAVEESTTRQQLVDAVGSVGGVTRVEDLLHAPGVRPSNMTTPVTG